MMDYIQIRNRYEQKQGMISEIQPSLWSKAHLDKYICDKEKTTPKLHTQIRTVSKKRHIAERIKSNKRDHKHRKDDNAEVHCPHHFLPGFA